MKLVLKIGGHSLTGRLGPRTLLPYLNVIRTLASKGHRIVIVTGGGEIARQYIELARRFKADESSLDEIGIDVARLNARLLIASLGEIAWPHVATTLEEVAMGIQSKKVVLMGGLTPGQSTTAVSALAAERIGASLLVVATNVDGVYSADPRRKGARRLEKVTPRELRKILEKSGVHAGQYELVDLVTLSILERSSMKTIILNGGKPEDILKAVSGAKIGTLVS